MVFDVLIIAVLVSAALVSCSGAQDGSFKLPTEFLGLWAGTPDFNIMVLSFLNIVVPRR